jgi:hypothetical protein
MKQFLNQRAHNLTPIERGGGRTAGRGYRQTNRQTDGRTDRRTDGKTERQTDIKTELKLGLFFVSNQNIPCYAGHYVVIYIFLSLVHFSREFSTSRFSQEVPFLARNENETRSRSWLE